MLRYAGEEVSSEAFVIAPSIGEVDFHTHKRAQLSSLALDQDRRVERKLGQPAASELMRRCQVIEDTYRRSDGRHYLWREVIVLVELRTGGASIEVVPLGGASLRIRAWNVFAYCNPTSGGIRIVPGTQVSSSLCVLG